MKKRLWAVLAILALLTGLGAGALAENTGVTIALPSDAVAASDAQFSAWRLLDLTVTLKENGDAAKDDDYNYYYTLNSKYASILRAAVGDADALDSEVLSYIADLTEDSEDMDAWAHTVYEAIQTADLAPEYTATANGVIPNAAQGYYLIAETTETIADGDSRSLVMLDTHGANALTVQTKEDAPTAQLVVRRADDAGYVKAVLAVPGDTVYFQLTGTLPASRVYARYGSYSFTFEGELPQGLTYVKDSAVVAGAPAGAFEITYPEDETARKLTVSCDDLKTKAPSLTGDETITVTYAAKVESGAALENISTATLEYACDPYVAAATARTVSHAATVYACALRVTNVDKDNAPLSGAGFTLYRVEDGTETLVDTAAAGSGGVAALHFLPAADDTYKLRQTTPPSGYMPVDDITFTVSPTLNNSAEETNEPRLTELTVSNGAVTAGTGNDLGALRVTVQNTVRSLRMPGTGGAGAAVYIGAGAVLLLVGVGALILLRLGRREDDP